MPILSTRSFLKLSRSARPIASRKIDSWFASVLPNSIDAIFVRIWVGNSIAMIPVSVVLFLPSTVNYFVVLAYSAHTADHPVPLRDHRSQQHPQPHLQSQARCPAVRAQRLRACRFCFENVLRILSGRIPDFYRIQHVYVHHVEDNGPDDSQSTMPYDRTSFLDFSRHALRQGLDLVSGYIVIPYLRRRNKARQLRELLRGIAVWYAFLIVLAIFNPIASALIFFSRLFGGNIQSMIAFYQHGVIDASDVYDVHGNTMDYHRTDHGNLGDDYHVEHHLKPARHWSKYYEEFERESANAGGHRSFVMNKEMFTPLAFVGALWSKDYAHHRPLCQDPGRRRRPEQDRGARACAHAADRRGRARRVPGPARRDNGPHRQLGRGDILSTLPAELSAQRRSSGYAGAGTLLHSPTRRPPP